MSASGTPSMCEMTRIGSGKASASLRSTGPPRSAMTSSSSLTTPSMKGSSSATRAGVNAFITSRRMRVCSGGSGSMRLSWNIELCLLIRAASGRAILRLRRESVSSARTSSYRVTIRAWSPLGKVTGTTGSSRIPASSSGTPRAVGRANG